MLIYLTIILVILLGEYILELIVEGLNLRFASPALPQEFGGYYDAEKYKRSQQYLKEGTRFKLAKDGFFLIVVLAFILSGGFNYADRFARSFNSGVIVAGLVFSGTILFALQLLNIPFSVYRTFVIEERYGFNKTTPRTFILDIVKSWTLGALIGGVILAGVFWFFAKTGKSAWVYCWLGVTLFQLFLVFIAPVLILPLFNKFVPLENGELKEAINRFASQENFKLKGIFKMDASRRSAKTNAFFTGFGKYRRIALFDTLIAKHTTDELLSVLAHEIGHFKKKHIIKRMTISTITAGIMFFILSLFINNEELFSAFKMEELSIYASLFFFGFLYIPINMVFSVLSNAIFRRHEYAADAYAVSSYKKPQAFIAALKKLSVENLSNLTPHPLKVFLDYSHPPILQRIQAIENSL